VVRFGDVAALDGLDLTVRTGSVAAIIGPSGCGKSTLLRVVAGLQRTDTGKVWWDGDDVTGVPPHLRGFGLMFQDYALFPHRTVAGNVAFGLRMAGVDTASADARVGEVLDLVGLNGYGDRHIEGLSGGEQQRVALARTLAPRPALVMLDEPIGSLDRSLRERLLAEMRHIFDTLEVTVLYVTHDQEEAFALADDVAVMRDGRIVAQDSVGGLWRRPGSVWTARFLGHDNVVAVGSTAAFAIAGVAGNPTGATALALPVAALEVTPAAAAAGRVVATTLQRGRHRVSIEIGGVVVIAEVRAPIAAGTPVAVGIAPDAVIPLVD